MKNNNNNNFEMDYTIEQWLAFKKKLYEIKPQWDIDEQADDWENALELGEDCIMVWNFCDLMEDDHDDDDEDELHFFDITYDIDRKKVSTILGFDKLAQVGVTF